MSDATFRKRLLIFFSVIGVCAIVIVARYGSIMLASPLPNSDTHKPASERGPILDRNGRLLAIQTAVYTVSAWAPNLSKQAQTAKTLAPLLQLDEKPLLEKLLAAKGAVSLKTGLDKEDADAVQKVIDDGGAPGIYIEETVARSYPENAAAAQVIGFTGTDNEGLEGIEYVMEKDLASGSTVLPDGRAYGNQVFLTLDMGIQHAFEKIADKAVTDNKPEALMLLAMDSASGEILAYVVRPGFDPNNFKDSSVQARRNLPVQYTYEPGSVFKVFTISSIMQLGGITDASVFDTSGGYRSKLFRTPITDLENYGTINPEGIIKYSSNVGAAFASDTVSVDQFYYMIRNFGFGDKTGIELNGEEIGQLKNPSDWSPRSKPAIAMGQEVAVTAIQMLSAATALANDGVLLRPHVVKQVVSPSGQILRESKREPIRQVISPDVAHTMLRYMNSVTEDGGTGHRSRIQGIDLSVKTGTAQSFDVDKGKYSDTDFVASALAIFPTQAPKVIVYVVIMKPNGPSILGGRIAAPIIKDSAEFLIPYLGIHRDGDQIYTQDSQLQVSVPTLPQFTDTVPDFRGLPLRTLIPLYARGDIQVQINGEGRVTDQDPPPGTRVKAGLVLTLTLQNSEQSQ